MLQWNWGVSCFWNFHIFQAAVQLFTLFGDRSQMQTAFDELIVGVISKHWFCQILLLHWDLL